MLRAALAAVVLALAAPFAWSDLLVLKDGRTLEGRVLEETRTAVTFEYLLAHIPTVEEFPRFRVASLETRPLPEGFFDGRKAEPEAQATPRRLVPAAAPAAAPARARYLLVPITGTIGEQVTSSGIRDVLRRAERNGAEHVVFVVDSPGGLVGEAERIMEVLREGDDRLVYHTFIDAGAISAATVFAACADHLYAAPDATLGGAVAYTTSGSTGSARVDAKLNSIWGARLAARAESKGRSGPAFRAMVVQEAELWLDASGALAPARAATGDQRLDASSTVLTLTAAQMERTGMAEVITDAAAIGPLRGLDGWQCLPGVGETTIRAAARRRQSISDRHAHLKRQVEVATEAAIDADPQRRRYRVDYRTGRFTGAALGQWQQDCDTALRRWREVRTLLLALAKLDDEATADGALHLVTDEDEGNTTFAQVEEHLKRIDGYRFRASPP